MQLTPKRWAKCWSSLFFFIYIFKSHVYLIQFVFLLEIIRFLNCPKQFLNFSLSWNKRGDNIGFEPDCFLLITAVNKGIGVRVLSVASFLLSDLKRELPIEPHIFKLLAAWYRSGKSGEFYPSCLWLQGNYSQSFIYFGFFCFLLFIY